MTEIDSPVSHYHETDCDLERTLLRLEEAYDRLALQASRDVLTGLPNRRFMERHLESRVNRGQSFAAIYIDLNGFKKINDIYGHVAGDELLRQVGERLRTVSSPGVKVGRWGGDEFVGLVEGGSAESRAVMVRVRSSIGKPFAVEGVGQKILLSAAVGVATWKPNDTACSLIQRADFAMYEEKLRLAG